MLAYDSKFLKIVVNLENKYFEMIRTSEYSTESIYKKELTKMAEVVEKYQFSKLILDEGAYTYVIEPEWQNWLNKEIFPRAYKYGLRQIAIILKDEIFLQISLEQTFEEKEGSVFDTEYFNEKEKAIKWILK